MSVSASTINASALWMANGAPVFSFSDADAPNVVKMSVCGNYFDDFDVVIFNELKYGVGIVAGIYYYAFARFFAGEDVTIDFERTDDGGYKDHDGSYSVYVLPLTR